MSNIIKRYLAVKRITAKDGNYFFGYFDKYPWNISQRYLLGHQTDFMGRQPKVGGKQ